MRRISVKVLTLLSVLAFARGSEGDEPALEIPPSLILERFAVSKNSDFLLVPVSVNTKEFLFLVDTGADVTVFDTLLPLGEPIGVVTADGAEGEVAINLYSTPDAKLGRISLGSLDVVAGTDLKYIRQVSGLPIQGILGMDFLGKYVVHVNVVKGELLAFEVGTEECRESRCRSHGSPAFVRLSWLKLFQGNKSVLPSIRDRQVGAAGVWEFSKSRR